MEEEQKGSVKIIENDLILKNNRRAFADVVIDQSMRMESEKNILFSLAFIVLNIIAMLIIGVVVTNITECVDFYSVLEGLHFNYIYLIIGIMCIRGIIVLLSDFVLLYKKTKQKKFIPLLSANIKNYYHSVTSIYNRKMSVYAGSLYDGGVNKKDAANFAYGKYILQKISNLMYCTIVFLLGCIIAFDISKLWVIVLGFVVIVIDCFIVLFVICFDKNKEKCVSIIGAVSKFLFKIKLIKDYEQFYLNCVDYLIAFKIYLKSRKLLLGIGILCNIITKFLKHFMIFVALCMINLVDYGVLVEVLFYATLLDLLADIFPLSKGSVADSVLFVLLYNSTFFDGYVLWGLLIYKLLDYYLPILFYYILKVFKVLSFCKVQKGKCK